MVDGEEEGGGERDRGGRRKGDEFGVDNGAVMGGVGGEDEETSGDD